MFLNDRSRLKARSSAIIASTAILSASATILAGLSGCGKSASNADSPRIATHPDVTIKLDGKRGKCIVALSSEAQGSTISCDDVVPFVKDELRLPKGAIYDIGATADGDQAELAKVRANLNGAGYRSIGGSP